VSPKKDFDCVEMKASIQAQLLEESQRLGQEEARRMQWERALATPALRQFLQRLSDAEATRAA